jgi:hypothetical protein
VTIESLTAAATSTRTSPTAVLIRYDSDGFEVPTVVSAYGKAIFVAADGNSFVVATPARRTRSNDSQ